MKTLQHTVGMETFLWVYLLLIVRPRGTSLCKVPPNGCGQTCNSFMLPLSQFPQSGIDVDWGMANEKNEEKSSSQRHKEKIDRLIEERSNSKSRTCEIMQWLTGYCVRRPKNNTDDTADNYRMFCSWYSPFLYVIVSWRTEEKTHFLLFSTVAIKQQYIYPQTSPDYIIISDIFLFQCTPLRRELRTSLSFITVQYGAPGWLNRSSQTEANSPASME